MATEWMPRAGREAAAGVVWLPRMLDKARRLVESEGTGKDLLSPYMFGDADPADGAALRFLGTDQAGVLALLRRGADDDKVVAELVRRSRRTPPERAACEAVTVQSRIPLGIPLDSRGGGAPPRGSREELSQEPMGARRIGVGLAVGGCCPRCCAGRDVSGQEGHRPPLRGPAGLAGGRS